jgi:xyloglucan-specific exo-beta-1,4-glucanase
VDGFVHTDVTKVPALADAFSAPTLSSGDSLDFAETNPADIVRTGDVDRTVDPNTNRIGFSTDGGKDWFQGQEPAGVTGGGTAVIASDGSATVWSPAGAGVSYSTSFGGSWSASTGIPQGAVVASDRVDPTRFYGFSGGTFYSSATSGATFTATVATGLPTSGTVFVKAVAGHEGDIWLAGGPTGGSGIWHSTNGGVSFTKLSTVSAADNIGFGKAAPGQTYPALFAVATVGGTAGVYRSDDTGASWVRVNDNQHQYGNIGQAITGDPRIYGRVYVGTNGRGIVYADLAGTTTTPPPTTTTTPPPTTTTSTTTAPPPPTGTGCHVTYERQSEWAGGFTTNVTVNNTSTTAVNGWTVKFAFPGDQKETSAWNATVTQSGQQVTATNVGYNAAIGAGGNVTFGMQGTWASNDSPPTVFTLNGTTCSYSSVV